MTATATAAATAVRCAAGGTPVVQWKADRYPHQPACTCGWVNAWGYVAEHAAMAIALDHAQPAPVLPLAMTAAYRAA